VTIDCHAHVVQRGVLTAADAAPTQACGWRLGQQDFLILRAVLDTVW